MYGYGVRRQQAPYYGQSGRRITQEYGESWRERSEPDPDYGDLPCDSTGVNGDTGVQEHGETKTEDMRQAEMGRTQGHGDGTYTEQIQIGRAPEYGYEDLTRRLPGTRPREDSLRNHRRPQTANHLYGDQRHMERRDVPIGQSEFGDGIVAPEEVYYSLLP